MQSIQTVPHWLDTQLYPFEHKSLQLSTGKMHYIDEGQGEILLFVHGTPSWSFLYRKFIQELSSVFRCIAIDHLGFGLSGAPADFTGTPQDHASNLEEFIRGLNLDNITLVVHDFGGPIGLGAALQMPHRVKRIVLFNTWLWATKENPLAQKVNKIVNGAIGRFFYLNLNYSPKVLLKQAFSDKNNLPKQVHKQYLHPFPNKRSRYPLLNIAKSLVGSSDWYEAQWRDLGKLSDKPCLILWGMQDPFLTPDYLDTWRKRLPNAQVLEFSCGHFVQEERPGDAIAEIRRFVEMENNLQHSM